MSKLVVAAFTKQALSEKIDDIETIVVGALNIFAYPQPADQPSEEVAIAHDLRIRKVARHVSVVPVPFGHLTGSENDIEQWAEQQSTMLMTCYDALHNVAQVSLFVSGAKQSQYTSPTDFLRHKSSAIKAARTAKREARAFANRLVDEGILTDFDVDHSKALEDGIRIDGLMNKAGFDQTHAALGSLLRDRKGDIRIAGPFFPYRFFSLRSQRGPEQ